nr:MAG TPA: hypothetical protein [Caudoviricetes sp.]DAJ42854.1 MAG TPA: hypothetical protein [Caudoviricetes sp.]
MEYFDLSNESFRRIEMRKKGGSRNGENRQIICSAGA